MDGEDGHMKRCEECNLVVSKTFGSEEEGYQFYNYYAKQLRSKGSVLERKR
jgi:hypothetical protein